jgi:anti-sigma factor RsiW
MKNPAREKFLPLLSPYVDGELTPEERQQVEQHLQNNKESAAQVADFRAGDGLIRHALELQADDVDWKKFTDDVLARVTPDKLPLFERLRLALSEMVTYQRGPLVAGLVGAAAAVAIAVPLSMKLGAQAPDGYASPRVEVQTVAVEESATVRPLVMETEGGDAIIWMVEGSGDGGAKKKKKRSGEESEEELKLDAPIPEKSGDL